MTTQEEISSDIKMDPEEKRDYWEYIEEQMALFKVHFPLSTAEDRYNLADKSWDDMMKIIVKREAEYDMDEEHGEDQDI